MVVSNGKSSQSLDLLQTLRVEKTIHMVVSKVVEDKEAV